MSAASDTIFALSSGIGRAAIAIVRMSGPRVREALGTMTGGVPRARQAVLRDIRAGDGRLLDRALVLHFPAPHSETGEDIGEFHLHGSRAVVKAVLEDLGARKGFRIAEPGEFARRALLNGKKDLLALEALGDLLEAETELQRRQAVGAGNLLRGKAETWRSMLIDVLAELAADIDFSDEGDVADRLIESQTLDVVMSEMISVLATARAGERVRDGVRVVIIGAPNAGKSSLLNALAGRDAAIVTPIAGTTRDRLEVHLDLNGLPVVLVDTAGIRDSSDTIELLGIQRAKNAIETADIVLWLRSPDVVASDIEFSTDKRVLEVWNKSDIAVSVGNGVNVSALTGDGLAGLVGLLERLGAELIGEDAAIVTRDRHRRCLAAAVGSLQAAKATLDAEVKSEFVRRACFDLESLVGRVGIEDVLDAVFSRFCIGK